MNTLPQPMFESVRRSLDARGVAVVLMPVEPQLEWIESSGRWKWAIPKDRRVPGCCESVVTASREWWEYLLPEQLPHQLGEVVELKWRLPLAPCEKFDPAIDQITRRLTVTDIRAVRVRDMSLEDAAVIIGKADDEMPRYTFMETVWEPSYPNHPWESSWAWRYRAEADKC